MNRRQQRLVLEYLQDANLTQAAIRAGYKPHWSRHQLHRLSRNPAIREALDREMAARAARTGVTAQRVIDELMRVAFAEIGALVEWEDDGARMKPSAALSRDETAAIAELVLGGDGRIARLRLHDKGAALGVLARRLRLFAPPPAGGMDADPKARIEARLAALG
jgi:phage terminase small subunit